MTVHPEVSADFHPRIH